MASSSSSSSSFTLPSLFSIAVLILTVSTAESLKPPLHPRDLLPLLPKQVSWPILNSLYGAADLLPTFIGTASPGNDDVKWKGACFYENTAYLEFHNKSGTEFGGGTLHIQADKAHSWTCMDLYVFATPYRVTWTWYFISRAHTVEFPEWDGLAEYEYVKNKGVSIFLMHAGMLGTLQALWDVFPLFTNTGWGESSNLAFLEKHMGAEFEARPEPWVTNVTTDQIQSGDLLAISKIRGRWGGFETLEKWVSGAYAGHSAVCLRDSEGRLWVGESGNENEKGEDVIAILPWEEWWEFELTKDDSNPQIALLPLHPDVRAKFNVTAAWEYARSMEGKPYGYHNLIFSWIDTVSENYPPPLDSHLVASFMTVWSKMQPDYAANMWNEALNKRLGTKGLDLSDVLVEVEKRGSSFDKLLAIPEQDDWIYSDGKSTSCIAFILEMYKEGGLFGSLADSVQVTEFTIKDAYMLNFFETNSSRLPKWCNDNDNVKLPYCQILGKYRMQLPGYNTMEPYTHMNEQCPSLPPKYIYIVTIEGDPIISYQGGENGYEATAVESDERIDTSSELVTSYARHLERKHDMILGMLFEEGSYKKLYSYKHLINGFAVHVSPEQAETLRRTPGVKSVNKDWKVRRLTTHTPEFLGLPTDVWPTGGGFERAGEDIVIGFVDSGIYPHHPSFASHHRLPYGPLHHYKGKCEEDPHTKKSFCNRKIVGAQHFAEAAKAAGAFNPNIDYASPMDGDGHGSHTAAIAAGNNGIPLRMHGYEFGRASGMAPRARIAVYKALYRLFGGFVADVVAAIDQAVHDGVDILSLSVGPNSPPTTTKTTFLNPFDATLLGAVKAGVFVAQAAGNGGPFPKTLVSYSPWITTVAAAIDDRRYKNHLTLGNGKLLAGMGLSPSTRPHRMYTLVSANDVLLDSSVSKYNPSDCQRPEVFNKKLVEGKILLCGYSFNFVVGTASIKKVVATVKHLGAAGFVLVVENVSPGTKFDPVPSAVPGILITDVSKSMDLIDYYNVSTTRDWTGRVKSFNAEGSIGDGLAPVYHKSAPQVALFSARGPNTKDFSFQDADLLKPDILAPGYLIWAAWCPNGTDEPNYVGEGFALISGTSMAAPHIAGIAALVKQKYPQWSPAAIKSALMTTSTVIDRAGRLLQAQQYSDTEAVTLMKATPFDYGSGHVNPHAALDPGLVFDAGYEDYLGFLCTTPGIDSHEIRNYTNTPCNYDMKHPSNFNAASIAISHLVGTQTVTRRVTNVAEVEETYTITARMQPSTAIEVSPPAMTLRPGASRIFSVTLTVRSVSGVYSFGEVKLKGSRGHKVRIPVVALGHRH